MIVLFLGSNLSQYPTRHTQPPKDRRKLGIPRSIQERAHFPPILNKFIYYLNRILRFCPQNLSAKSWQNFGTVEFRYFVKVVNKLIQNRWEMCSFLYIISEYRDFSDPLLVGLSVGCTHQKKSWLTAPLAAEAAPLLPPVLRRSGGCSGPPTWWPSLVYSLLLGFQNMVVPSSPAPPSPLTYVNVIVGNNFITFPLLSDEKKMWHTCTSSPFPHPFFPPPPQSMQMCRLYSHLYKREKA